MILASHQPNFLPYMGYIYKMYMCDKFSFADEVKFTRNVYHNYTDFCTNRELNRCTVPINSHSLPFKDTKLVDYKITQKKLLKRIQADYRRAKNFDVIYPELESIIMNDYENLIDLNMDLLSFIVKFFEIDLDYTMESSLGLKYENPNDDIIDICQKLGCNKYISGVGARDYIDEEKFKKNGIEVIWTGYKPRNYGSFIDNGSCLDYMMVKGKELPDEWKKERELLHG